MSDTIRERALEALKAILVGMKKGSPASDPYTMEFSKVTRADIGDLAKGKRFACGIYEGEERKTIRQSPLMHASLQVSIEFHATIQKDETPSIVLNMVLGNIQRLMREDTTFNGLILDITEIGNEFDIDGPFDGQSSGVVVYDMQYRHSLDDPRTGV